MQAQLWSHFGDDLMVVNAARVSYGKRVDTMTDRDIKLLNYLVEHKHTSPFRHPQLQFRIECPIFVERQLFKHQVGLTANSISGRYVDFSDEYWLPKQLRLQSTSSKQGSSGPVPEPQNAELVARIGAHIEQSQNLYADLVEAGVAKEQCRIVLPLCLNTQFVWTGSFAAFVHLWKLRLKPDAQEETRELARLMLSLVQTLPGEPFKHSLAAFGF